LDEVIDGVRPKLLNAVVIASDGTIGTIGTVVLDRVIQTINYTMEFIHYIFADGTRRVINIFFLYFINKHLKYLLVFLIVLINCI